MTAPSSLGAISEMKRAVLALGYELPETVWVDVRVKWNAVVAEVERLRADSVPRSALVHVKPFDKAAHARGCWYQSGGPCDCTMQHKPVYVIRTDSEGAREVP